MIEDPTLDEAKPQNEAAANALQAEVNSLMDNRLDVKRQIRKFEPADDASNEVKEESATKIEELKNEIVKIDRQVNRKEAMLSRFEADNLTFETDLAGNNEFKEFFVNAAKFGTVREAAEKAFNGKKIRASDRLIPTMNGKKEGWYVLLPGENYDEKMLEATGCRPIVEVENNIDLGTGSGTGLDGAVPVRVAEARGNEKQIGPMTQLVDTELGTDKVAIPNYDDTDYYVRPIADDATSAGVASLTLGNDYTVGVKELDLLLHANKGVEWRRDVMLRAGFRARELLLKISDNSVMRGFNRYLTIGTGTGQMFGITAVASQETGADGQVANSGRFTNADVKRLIKSPDVSYDDGSPSWCLVVHQETGYDLVLEQEGTTGNTGAFLYQSAFQGNLGPRVAGVRLVYNNDMPKLGTAGNIVAVLGQMNALTFGHNGGYTILEADGTPGLNQVNAVNFNVVTYAISAASKGVRGVSNNKTNAMFAMADK